MWRTGCQHLRALCRRIVPTIMADKIRGSLKVTAVYYDANEIAIAHTAKRTAGQRLGSHVPNARSGAHAAEPGVGDQGHILPPGQNLEC